MSGSTRLKASVHNTSSFPAQKPKVVPENSCPCDELTRLRQLDDRIKAIAVPAALTGQFRVEEVAIKNGKAYPCAYKAWLDANGKRRKRSLKKPGGVNDLAFQQGLKKRNLIDDAAEAYALLKRARALMDGIEAQLDATWPEPKEDAPPVEHQQEAA